MTFANYILLAALIVTLPFVENAPSNKKTSAADIEMTLVFVDRRADNALGNKLPIPVQRSNIPSTVSHPAPVFSPNSAPLVDNFPFRPTGLPRMDDERQNWGFVVDDMELTEEDSYYNRPLNIPKTVKMIKNEKSARINPKVPRKETTSTAVKPGTCDVAALTCCTNTSTFQLNICFKSKGCPNLTEDMFSSVCSKEYISKVITNMGNYYRGSQEH